VFGNLTGRPRCPARKVPVLSAVRATSQAEEIPVTWTTPTLIEICIGLEINGYLPAEF
jgi:coenzyme PQQ precursor peptide PqqA